MTSATISTNRRYRR